MTEVDNYLQTLLQGDVLPERDLRILCLKVKEIMVSESNIQNVSAPVTLVGDLHGQFQDLLELIRVGG
mgnify:CR=1 FL=1